MDVGATTPSRAASPQPEAAATRTAIKRSASPHLPPDNGTPEVQPPRELRPTQRSGSASGIRPQQPHPRVDPQALREDTASLENDLDFTRLSWSLGRGDLTRREALLALVRNGTINPDAEPSHLFRPADADKPEDGTVCVLDDLVADLWRPDRHDWGSDHPSDAQRLEVLEAMLLASPHEALRTLVKTDYADYVRPEVLRQLDDPSPAISRRLEIIASIPTAIGDWCRAWRDTTPAASPGEAVGAVSPLAAARQAYRLAQQTEPPPQDAPARRLRAQACGAMMRQWPRLDPEERESVREDCIRLVATDDVFLQETYADFRTTVLKDLVLDNDTDPAMKDRLLQALRMAPAPQDGHATLAYARLALHEAGAAQWKATQDPKRLGELLAGLQEAPTAEDAVLRPLQYLDLLHGTAVPAMKMQIAEAAAAHFGPYFAMVVAEVDAQAPLDPQAVPKPHFVMTLLALAQLGTAQLLWSRSPTPPALARETAMLLYRVGNTPFSFLSPDLREQVSPTDVHLLKTMAMEAASLLGLLAKEAPAVGQDARDVLTEWRDSWAGVQEHDEIYRSMMGALAAHVADVLAQAPEARAS